MRHIAWNKFLKTTDIIIDPKHMHSKRSSKQKKAAAELTKEIESVKSALGFKEKAEDALVQPLKETISASKALLQGGQKLASWVGGLFKR